MNKPEDATEHSTPVPKLQVLRGTCRIVVPTAFVCLIIGACSGFIPPWPVVIALSVGLIAGVASIVAKTPAKGVVIAVATVIFCVWLLRPVVDVRAASATDRIYKRYFGIDSYDENAVVTIRNIAVVTGTFTLGTWMTASLHHVNGGDVELINGFTVGRSPNQIGAPHWVDMKITLALGDRDTSAGRVTQLGSAGQSRGGGQGGNMTNNVVASGTRFLPGRLKSGTKRIVYVEGDREFHVTDAMTIMDFAHQNRGSYLVVELELH